MEAVGRDSRLHQSEVSEEADSRRKRLLQEMLFARRFEERCAEAYHHRDIGGFLHLYPGQEACAIGVLDQVQLGSDYVITGYRDHIHAIKTGVDPKRVMAELFGKETGCSKGRGGSMHLFDVGCRFMGGYAVVAEPLPLAAGIAKTLQLQGSNQIVVTLFGDGANNQGTCHETLNMAQLWRLPVLFVCENNLYAIGTALDRSTAVQDQFKRAQGHGLAASQHDGQDLDIVMAAAEEAIDYVRSGRGPYYLELMTYRLRGHSMSDAGSYRSEGEVQQWAQRDPIELFRQRLGEEGLLSTEEFQTLGDTIQKEIDTEIIPYAENSPEPDPNELTRYVLSENSDYITGPPETTGES